MHMESFKNERAASLSTGANPKDRRRTRKKPENRARKLNGQKRDGSNGANVSYCRQGDTTFADLIGRCEKIGPTRRILM